MVLIHDIIKKKIRQFRRLLISFIILLLTYSLWGQENQINLSKQVGFHDALEILVKDNKIIMGMDASLFGKEMLLAVHGNGYKHVKWKLYNNYIALEVQQVESLSGTFIPQNQEHDIKKEVLGIFSILKSNDPQTHYFDVSGLIFQNPWISTFSNMGATLVTDKSYLEEVYFFDNELIIKVRHLYAKNKTNYFDLMNFSLFLLPEPMTSRGFDHRMGFFAEDENSFINHYPKHAKGSIARWRLEKRHRNNSVSEPKKPITLYFGPDVPEKWKPYIRAGIMEWAPAFEAAGFKNALKVMELPQEQRGLYLHSLQYSLIQWPHKEEVRRFEANHGSTVKKITDLRSGEILKADILIGSSYEDLMDKYFVRCSPLDPRTWQYPFPDDLLGELIQSVVAHEAGHAFGIKDANYGEYAYPFDKMRNRDWLEVMGHTPSIMSYARHNHIAQYKDDIPASMLIQKVGPMDVYQIQWGYGTFDQIGLEEFVRLQDSIPWYRYNLNQFEILGPGSGHEVADNDDPVSSIKLGLTNLKKVLELLPKVTRYEKDNALMERLYNKTLRLWHREMEQVLTLVGGYTIQYKSGDQKGFVYNPIPRKQQIKAIEFLSKNAFKVPDWLSKPEFLLRFRYTQTNDTLLNYQIKLLKEVISLHRLGRIEMTERSGESFKELLKSILATVSQGLFKNLGNEKFLDWRELELQRAYISLLVEAVTSEERNDALNGSINKPIYTRYVQSVFLTELALLKTSLEQSLSLQENGIIKAHLHLCVESLNTVQSYVPCQK